MDVRFFGSQEIYSMKVAAPGHGLVQLHPPLPDIPEQGLAAGFELLTEKGNVYGDYRDYTTVYRHMDDGSVLLSNDGRVWAPPPPPEPAPEPEPPTLEEVRAEKRREVGAACEQAIYSGITVETQAGPEHFSLTEKDQMNLFAKQAQLAAGAQRLEYHQDGAPCRYYAAEEMRAIATAAMGHVSYHTTCCNSINMWIMGAGTAEEVQGIFYGADIPEGYQSEVLKDYLADVMAQAGKGAGRIETAS